MARVEWPELERVLRAAVALRPFAESSSTAASALTGALAVRRLVTSTPLPASRELTTLTALVADINRFLTDRPDHSLCEQLRPLVQALHELAAADSVPLRANGEQVRVREPVVAEPLQLEVGVHARVAVDEQRIITCYLVDRTPAAGPQLAERVLFGAQLAVEVPEGQLAAYPDRDADTTAEAASLRLLYAASPVRAVGHGVDAVVTRIGGMCVVRTEALPVAAVTGTTPDIGDAHGPLAVDMDALGRWEPDAVATVERLIRSYRAWIEDLQNKSAQLTGAARVTADTYVRECQAFADDIEAGWKLAASDPVKECLK